MKIAPGNAQDIGRRKDQQDAFWFSDLDSPDFIAHGGVLAVLADGMGGLENGGEASRLAVRSFGEYYLTKPGTEAIPDTLREALILANRAVCGLSEDKDEDGNVGTTLVAAVVAQDSLHWISAGDSRIYLFRNGQLTQLTRDHHYSELLQQQVFSGQLSQEEAVQHPDRNALTSYLGLPELEEIDRNLRPFPLQAGDWVLLCSDGLHGFVGEGEIIQELNGSPQEAAERLVELTRAKNHPHQDNVTVVIMGCDLAELPTAAAGSGLKARLLRAISPSSRVRLAVLAGGVVLISALLGGMGYWLVGPPEPSAPKAAEHKADAGPAEVPIPVEQKPGQGEGKSQGVVPQSTDRPQAAKGAGKPSNAKNKPAKGEPVERPRDAQRQEPVKPAPEEKAKGDAGTEPAARAKPDEAQDQGVPAKPEDGQVPEPKAGELPPAAPAPKP